MTTQVVNPETTYTLTNGVLTPEVLAKLPPQLQEIVNIITEAGGTINKFDLLNEMTKRVKTGQPIQRILSFYKPRLVAANIVTVTEPAKAPKKTAEEKEAAKAAKLAERQAAKEAKLEEKKALAAEKKAAALAEIVAKREARNAKVEAVVAE